MQDKNDSAISSFVDFLSDIVVLADVKGKIIKLNSVAEKYFCELTQEVYSSELVTWLSKKACALDFIKNIENLIDSKEESLTKYDNRIFEKHDDARWAIIRSKDYPEIKIIGKKLFSEQEFHNLQRLFECIQETMPGVSWWKDKNGVYRGSNKNVVNMLGFKPEQIIGKTDHELTLWSQSADELVKHDNEVMSAGQTKKFEEVVLGLNGEKHTFLVMKSPLRNSNGEIIGTVGTSFEITDLKQAEEALRQAKEEAEAANRVKTEFLENMRHDIRTPLTGIVGFAQIIRDEVKEVKIKEYADNLVSSGQALLELLNEILEAIRVTGGEVPLLKKKFNLKEKLQDVIDLTQPKAKTKKLKLSMEYDESIPGYLIGDSKRIHRIILELVSNALNFTNKGSIKISASVAKTEGRSLVVKIKVADTGIGILQEKQQDIFTRFKRLSPSYEGIYKGAGLGLSLVKQFLDDIDGEIYVDSALDKGSTFTCLFPLKEALLDDDFGSEETVKREFALPPVKEKINPVVLAATNDEPLIDKSTITASRILVVEDQPLAAKIAKTTLVSLHCSVDIAENGKVALQKFEANSYDLIFMDVGLPDMDGCQVTREIRSKERVSDKHVPILALTAHIDMENKQRCLIAGMDAVLSKPLTKDKAIDLLNAFIPGRGKQEVAPPSGWSPPLSTPKTILSSAAEKVLDLELGAKLVGGKKVVALEMLDMLVASFPEEVALLDQAYETKNWENFKGLVHKMKGGTFYCGTPRLRDACVKLDEVLCQGITDKAVLTPLYQQVLQEIKAIETEHKPATKAK